MIEFWIAAALMLLLGYVFFLPALSGKTQARGPDRAKLNLILYRQRQQELAQETASPEDLERLSVESERNLLGDLETAGDREVRPGGAGRPALLAALLILPVFALIAYLALGRPDLLGQPPAGNMAGVEQSIQPLVERLKQNPNDLEGWLLLGHSLQATGQPDKAVTAYEYAMKLAPGNLDIEAMYAEAVAGANQGVLKGKPTEIVEGILRKDPNHKGGLWMAGIAAAERKDAAKAVEYWEKLKAQFPPESEEARQIGQYIAEVQGLSALPEASAPAAAREPGKRIRVKVSLADSVKEKAAPDDALFIFARAAEGPPMPLAVVRKQVRDLPVEVELNDAMAMRQGLNLSAFERIVIGARVSRSGKPTPSPGDLQGLGAPVAAENEGSYAVVVDRVIGEGGQ
jgi:cytochrome c-type biogenesis protein CcmH